MDEALIDGLILARPRVVRNRNGVERPQSAMKTPQLGGVALAGVLAGAHPPQAVLCEAPRAPGQPPTYW